MSKKTNDKNEHVETDGLPVLATPHFGASEIAQAKPVQPIATIRQRRTARTPRVVGLSAIVVAGLLSTIVLANAFNNTNTLLRSAPEVATQGPSDASVDLSEKDQSNVTREQHRKFTIRRIEKPRMIIRFENGDDRKPKARLVSVIERR